MFLHYKHPHATILRLCDEGGGSGALVPPGGREDTNGLVVAGETVDTGLDENEAELGVLVLAVGGKVLADGNSLLDEHVEVLGDLRCKTVRLEDSENLVTSDDLDLSDTVRVTEDLANLRGSGALLRKLGDLLDDLLGSGLEPRRRVARVGDSRGRYALSVAVKTTHCEGEY